MKVSAACAVLLVAALGHRSGREPIPPFESPASSASPTKLDRLVLDQLRRAGFAPARPCSDAVFCRRVYLDVIGTLPSAQEVRDFLADDAPKKRALLVDRLLQRPEFADYWAMKWSDLLRVKSEYPINLWPNAVQGYHRWIRTCIKENKPFDRFARELLTASGSNFTVPPANFFRAVESREPAGLAQAAALTFMGIRPESWSKRQWADMALFFSRLSYKGTDQWKEEIVMFDPGQGGAPSAAGATIAAVLPDKTRVRLRPDQDPREVFANWLTASRNPWFAKTAVNRVWSWLLGRGIVHEPDDFRPNNPPSNPELLAFLERELTGARFDLKHVYRLILNSSTYQQSSLAGDDRPGGDAYFARYLPRRLDAEVLIDAICQVTGTTEKYSSPIPEPFTFIPDDMRSIELPDASINSQFLDVFGRPPRDTGLESERNNRPTAAQQLHLLNSSHIRRKIEGGRKLYEILQAKRNRPRDVVDELYLTILSRPPTDDELKTVRDYVQSGGKDRRPMVDIVWAMINSPEFLYRH